MIRKSGAISYPPRRHVPTPIHTYYYNILQQVGNKGVISLEMCLLSFITSSLALFCGC